MSEKSDELSLQGNELVKLPDPPECGEPWHLASVTRKISSTPHDIASCWASAAMATDAVKHAHVRVDELSFHGSPKVPCQELVGALVALGGRVSFSTSTWSASRDPDIADDEQSLALIWPHALLTLRLSAKWVNVELLSTDAALSQKLSELFRSSFGKKVAERDFHMLTRDTNGYSLSQVRSKPSPLIRGNYEPSVIEDIDHVLEELSAERPCGRVVVIEGPPGTGKTHLVRGLVDAMPDCTVILFPPALLQEFSGPGVVSAFLDVRNNTKGPLVLVLEDADQCLAPRMGDNMASINELLSLGDGILGSALDVRIVATTNARKSEIDPAVLRPGRLCRRIDVDGLSTSTVEAIFEREGVPEEERQLARLKFKQKVGDATLADVYAVAKGWKASRGPRVGKLGFKG